MSFELTNSGNGGNQEQVEEVNLEKKSAEIAERVKQSPEVIEIAKTVDVSNPQTVMMFGQETAEGISQFADKILGQISKSTVEDSGQMLKQLTTIMKQFDKKDFEEQKPGFFDKLFKKVANEIEKLLAKYNTMDKEIEKVYVQIKQYESEISKSNGTLDEMFEKNMEYYEQLEKHIQAGHLIIEKTKNEWIPELQQKASSGNPMDQQEYNNAIQFLEMIDQRVHDLEMAKMVSLQTAPQIKLIQKGNYNLLRKINSAFVVTLPVFKTGLIQAITMKRQRIQADSMKALDDATNEMLKRNADNIAQNSVDIARLSGGTSVQMETLEKTFETIMKGIEETVQIEDENRQKRAESRNQIAGLQQKLKDKNF